MRLWPKMSIPVTERFVWRNRLWEKDFSALITERQIISVFVSAKWLAASCADPTDDVIPHSVF